ncbi:dTDP-4-dehydrorhamnose 3,5-epimerase family protein [Streptomyces sp. NPDC053427]|uniref:dTDP-4-dehydrorhamnose 3,5-epimerase family protein n=1 Tax=Streptomyces sp. NPDC053427 TaxID=3365701 RepID=UPI0037D09F60
MRSLSIEGAWETTPKIFEDRRGTFREWYQGADLRSTLGTDLHVAQANCSVSRRGALRGIHCTKAPPGQAKYVTCVSGAVMDVVVDLRTGSPTFKRWEAVRLDGSNPSALYLSEGLGHAFMALEDHTTVLYLCSARYVPELEFAIHPLDPELGIPWPKEIEPILSEKDAEAPTLAAARSSGLLPG